ncbi:MAG: hypothetical protein NVV59_11395 [Chitinophagaceae bacterium]|nr:hypothetical protein [Chitinophagaceae bacterium]
MEEGSFVVNDIQKIGQPDVDPAYTVTYELSFDNLKLQVRRPVLYKYTDPVKGEQYQPLAILPAMELKFAQDNYLFRNDAPGNVRVQFKSNRKDSIHYTITHQYSKRWSSSRPSFAFKDHPGNEEVAEFKRIDRSKAPLKRFDFA